MGSITEEEFDVDDLIAGPSPAVVKRKLSRLRQVAVVRSTSPVLLELPHKPRCSSASPQPQKPSSPCSDSGGSARSQPSKTGTVTTSGQGAAARQDSGVSDDQAGVSKEVGETAAESADEGADYWDEEDELDDHFRQAGEGGAPPGSEASGSGNSGERRSGSDDDDVSSTKGSPESQAAAKDSVHLNARTQRMLRECATRDRLGKGYIPEIKPLSDILEKLRQRKQIAASRAPTAARSVKAPTPAAAEQQLGIRQTEEDELLLIESDDDEGVGAAQPAQEVHPQLEPAPPAGAEAAAAVLPRMRCAPLDDTQDLDVPATDSLLHGLGGGALSGSPSAPHELPSLHLNLDTQPSSLDQHSQEDLELGEAPSPAAEEAAEVPSTAQDPPGRSGFADPDADIPQLELRSGSEEQDRGSGEDVASEEEAETSGSGEDEEGSDHADGEEDGHEDDGAGERVLLDHSPAAQKAKKASWLMTREFWDMEAEMSDDDGHSDDGDDDEDVADGMLMDLIGTARERAGEEEARAALHQAWQEAADEAELEKVMAGMKSGWRARRRGGLGVSDDEAELTDRDARRRRAAAAGEDWDEDEDGPDLAAFGRAGLLPAAAAGGEEAADGEEEGLANEREEAAEYQQAKLMLASQEVEMSLLDAGSQEVLGLLSRAASLPSAPPPPALRPAASRFGLKEVTNLAKTTSFLGRQNSSIQHRTSTSLAAGRSFVFGRDESNGAGSSDDPTASKTQLGHEEPAGYGPTNFAGLGKLASSAPLATKRAAVGTFPALLGLLSTPSSAGVTPPTVVGSSEVALKAVMVKRTGIQNFAFARR